MEVKSMQILCNLQSGTSSWKKMNTMVHVQNSPQEFEYIYSVILPKFSTTSTLIARDFQNIVVHGGRSAMMQEIRGSCYSWTSLVNFVWKGDKVTWRKKTLKKKNFMSPFYGWASTVSRLQSHYKKTVYFLSLRPREGLSLIWSTTERWKAELTLTWGPWIKNPAP